MITAPFEVFTLNEREAVLPGCTVIVTAVGLTTKVGGEETTSVTATFACGKPPPAKVNVAVYVPTPKLVAIGVTLNNVPVVPLVAGFV